MQTFDVGKKSQRNNQQVKQITTRQEISSSLELSRRRHPRPRPFPAIVKLPHDKPVMHPVMSLTDLMKMWSHEQLDAGG
jgi:hypothetical protein